MSPSRANSRTGFPEAPNQLQDRPTALVDCTLFSALHRLVAAKSLEEAAHSVCATARQLLVADGASLVLRQHGKCLHAEDPASSPQPERPQFSSTVCITGWVMEHRAFAAISDIRRDPRISPDTRRESSVRSLLMVPIGVDDPIGTIGAYWKTEHSPDSSQLAALRILAVLAAAVIDQIGRRAELEESLREARAELETTQRKLGAEISLRSQLDSEVRLLDQIDPLTGLNNRVGFLARAGQLLKLVSRVPLHAWLIYIDLDGLRRINSTLGYEAGDLVIQDVARVLRESFRESDLIARVRDDEFVAFAAAAADPLTEIEARLTRNIDHVNRCHSGRPRLRVTIGAVRCDPRGNTTIEELIHQADAAMYRAKRNKRVRLVDKQTS